MNAPQTELRPRLLTEGGSSAIAGALSTITDQRAQPTVARPVRRKVYAVLVAAERADGRVVTQVYTSLHAAERRVLRTRERGLSAWVEMVRLVPVPLVSQALLALVGDLGDEQ